MTDRARKRGKPDSTCAVPGCRVRIWSTHLMCVAHWRQVPYPLQVRVYRTWDRLQSAQQVSTFLVDEYQAARQAAVDAVAAPPISSKELIR